MRDLISHSASVGRKIQFAKFLISANRLIGVDRWVEFEVRIGALRMLMWLMKSSRFGLGGICCFFCDLCVPEI